MKNSKHLKKQRSRSQSTSGRNEKFTNKRTNSSSDNLLSLINAFESALDGIGEECDQRKKVLDKLQSIQTKIESKISLLSFAEEKMLSSNAVDSEYENYLSKVSCPFCKQDQMTTSHLIKHIDIECSPHLMKQLDKPLPLLYSTFQILPNNTFKCNVCPNSVVPTIKQHFYHSRNPSHQNHYLNASSSKTFKDSLFCASCKILVSNNFTELHHHINHEHHNYTSSMVLDKKTNAYVYNSNKKLKCLVCQSHPTFPTVKDFKNHLSSLKHNKHLHLKNNEKFSKTNESIYCELCRSSLDLNTLEGHLDSGMHILNEKKSELEGLLQFCMYCTFKCFDLTELSNHMSSECKLIHSIRNSPAYKSIKLNEDKHCAKLQSNDLKEKSHKNISSKGNVELEISDEEVESTSSESDFDEEKEVQNDFSMDFLIQKISLQIMYSLEEKENDSHDILIKDCKKALNSNCESIGFHSFTLSDPSVIITLFCHSNFLNEKYLNNEDVIKCVLESSKYVLMNSGLWKKVEVHSRACVPHISCIHKGTNMRCNMTLVEEEKKLRNYLRDCGKVHSNLQIFFHMVKLWFEAHKINLEEMCIVCLVIFFLISREMVNVPIEANEIHKTLLKNFSFKEKTRESASAPISEIFQKFMVFLYNFDFINFSICLPISWPVPKKLLSNNGSAKLVQHSSSLFCILGPSLQINFGSNATNKILKKLKFFVQKSI